jgi:hypothetical protein
MLPYRLTPDTYSFKEKPTWCTITSVYYVKHLHVSGVSIAHQQEVHHMDTTICTYCSVWRNPFSACTNALNMPMALWPVPAQTTEVWGGGVGGIGCGVAPPPDSWSLPFWPWKGNDQEQCFNTVYAAMSTFRSLVWAENGSLQTEQ